MPITSTTTGTVGGNIVTLNNTDYVATVENYQCTIELAVDEHDVIKHFDWRGNLGGCANWARRLKPAT